MASVLKYAFILFLVASVSVADNVRTNATFTSAGGNYYAVDNVTFTALDGYYVATIGGAAPPSGWTDTATGGRSHHDFETTNATQTLDVWNSYNASNKPSVASGPAWTIAGTNQNARVEHSYTFDGSDDRHQFTIDSTFSNNLGTLCFWMYKPTDDNRAQYSWMIGKNSGSGTPYLFVGYLLSGGDEVYSQCVIGGTVQWYCLTQAQFMDDHIGKWLHVTLRQAGTEPEYLFNGVLYTNLLFSGANPDKTAWVDDMTGADTFTMGSLAIGGGNSGNYAGYLDDFRYYTNALSDAEVLAIYSNTHPTNNIEVRP